ncbi:MAG: optic atrophy 3 protein-domain-containing protein [Monoraphidium minutum]|nr:MAG: optic atrophy 3 protein-domain-containing protein [Monoraphidium minutum]
MAALVFKLGALMMKTLSKPLADRFKTWVMSHPQHRQNVLRMAEYAHRMEIGITRRAEGKEGRAFIGVMTEEKSVELASKIASEGFLFSIGALLVFAEYDRTRKKEVKKQRREQAERQEIVSRAQEERERLVSENLQQQAVIEQLVARIDHIDELLQAWQEEQARRDQRSMWGGFFGLKGLPQRGG